jgi:hypothetical protein
VALPKRKGFDLVSPHPDYAKTWELDHIAPRAESANNSEAGLTLRPSFWESQMTAVARAFSRVFLSTSREFDVLKELASLGGAGLLVSLLMLTYGIDLSPGFY